MHFRRSRPPSEARKSIHPTTRTPLTRHVGGSLEPYFFLSYARKRGPRVLVKRFYDDLCAELRQELRRLHKGNTVPFDRPFFDVQSIQVGQDWNAALGEALGRCRTMLALYTPDYFRSDFCGREWKAFEDRQRRHRTVTGVDAKALIPVLWEPVQNIPSGAAHIQYDNFDFGENYARWGLRRILVADPGGEEYRRIVNLIAHQVLVAAEHFRILPVSGLDLTTPEAAGPFPSAAERAEPGSHALLLVAARTSTEAHNGATDPGCHGDSPTDWNPYHADGSDPLAARASQLLEERGFAVRTEIVSDAMGASLDEARGRGQVAVLLVEAMAAADEPFGRALRAYDQSNHPGSAAIVPCGPEEAGDGPRSKAYWDAVRGALPFNWAKGVGDPLPLLQSGVSSDQFDGALHAVVVKVQNHLVSFLGTLRTSLLELSQGLPPSLPVLSSAAPLPDRPTPGPPPTPARPFFEPIPIEEQEQDR
ncbi:TIR-like protein FxsC [Streptomyces caniscabiei]|uniref:TIR-like protein FxsC n=1 Tax=Streptomyces caniscabiei TaxID=2746961 RepID=UPI0023DA7996|nr:TIR-like protein FxsC [Streptomyces caniscabiei]MDX3514266.1 TIR-like protein FxsC [Streptomyces caniscabiei]MDX3716708.1 TIR-like protein FxsC [Streptomyces caniscabiei]MDX3730894.1 TIR-like protein FxsC [Streptomyces caniscabiei]WEO22592.1 TIR-like protein FxsC [Streptomyces caniscabiei]